MGPKGKKRKIPCKKGGFGETRASEEKWARKKGAGDGRGRGVARPIGRKDGN